MNRLIICGILLLLLIIPACGNDSPAAVVNGDVITMEQLEKEVQSLDKAIQEGGFTRGGMEDEEYSRLLRKEALDMLVRDLVLLQELEKRNIELDYDKAEEYMNMVREIYGEELFLSILESGGTSEEKFIEDFALNEATERLYGEVTGEISVSQAEVREYFELNPESFYEGRASHILLRIEWEQASADKLSEAEEKALKIIERLDDGEDFSEMAREFSDDGSAEQGGRLDESFSMLASPYVDEFTLEALKLEEGEITGEPVVSDFGLHIIKLDEKITDFDSLEESVKQHLLREKKDEYFREYIQQLYDDSEIEIFVETGDNGE